MFRFLLSLVKAIYLFVRFITPWLLTTVWWSIKLIGVALGVMWDGIVPGIEYIADSIGATAKPHIPVEFWRVIRPVAKGVAILTVFTGWVMLSYVTVWIVERIMEIL